LLLCKVNDFAEIFEIKTYYTMKTTLRNTFLFTALIVLVFSFTSCYKKQPTIAHITVLTSTPPGPNSPGPEPVGGAEVRLFYGVNADSARIDKLGTTGADGIASFNFNDLYKSGQAGFAVLDIYVGGVVVGIIKIEEETISEETVSI
jgi:hypothetical protein